MPNISKNPKANVHSESSPHSSSDKQKIQLYEMILDHLDVGIHVIDANETTVVYNPVIARLEGQNPKNLLGKKLLEAMPHLKSASSTLLAAIRAGKPLSDLHQTYVNAQGKQINTVNSTVPLVLDGKVVGALEIAKDVTYIQALAETIANLHQNLAMQKKLAGKPQPFHAHYTLEDIIGSSEPIQSLKFTAFKTARTSSNVLIYGETGTGKELFAQSIHNASPRKNHPFIGINCAALPEHLLEGLLFGTTRGAFTGAIDRPGFFEQADGGTLLLDEINSMPLELQAKLLRVIQERSVRRVGASAETPIDVRIISTVNIDPADAIVQKQLRSDLYYRLGVVTLHIPPLRDHCRDIPDYIDQFLAIYNRSMGSHVSKLSEDVLSAFYLHDWPGNVRELQHAIEGALNLISTEKEIQMCHLPPLFRSNLATRQKALLPPSESHESKNLVEQRTAVEMDLISEALINSRGNITRAAASLGLTRQLLQYKMKKYNLK